MRRSRFRGKGFRKKRTVSWLEGVTSYDAIAGVSNRLVSLAVVSGNVWGANIGVVIPTDLPMHGGEDAVLTRIRGRLGFMDGRKDAGAGMAAFGYQMRVLVVKSDFIPAAGTVSPFDYTSSAGLGNDDILWEADVIAPNQAIGAAGAGYDLLAGGYERWLDVDVQAKRRVDGDSAILLWFQTVMPAGTTGADFRLIGGLRTLLMSSP